jgi:glutamate dehydrogenase (NADP+)
MLDCYTLCYETGKEFSDGGELPSLCQGANIAGFKKVADACKQHGDWF